MFSWFFARKKAAEGKDETATAPRRLEDLESQVRLLKTEWYDVLDRLERLAGRVAKRAERAGGGALLAASPSSEEAPPPPGSASPGMLMVLKRRAPRGTLPTGG